MFQGWLGMRCCVSVDKSQDVVRPRAPLSHWISCLLAEVRPRLTKPGAHPKGVWLSWPIDEANASHATCPWSKARLMGVFLGDDLLFLSVLGHIFR
jgi:hypothetical protein